MWIWCKGSWKWLCQGVASVGWIMAQCFAQAGFWVTFFFGREFYYLKLNKTKQNSPHFSGKKWSNFFSSKDSAFLTRIGKFKLKWEHQILTMSNWTAPSMTQDTIKIFRDYNFVSFDLIMLNYPSTVFRKKLFWIPWLVSATAEQNSYSLLGSTGQISLALSSQHHNQAEIGQGPPPGVTSNTNTKSWPVWDGAMVGVNLEDIFSTGAFIVLAIRTCFYPTIVVTA